MVGDIGAHLRKARFDAVERLAELANQHEVDAVLVAGDVFDNPFPDTKTLYSALQAMARYKGPWVLLPGNHDPGEGSDLWQRVAALADGLDLHLALEAAPLVLLHGALSILPAPLHRRHGFDDPTAWMDGVATPSAAVRVGLAHGSVREFGSSTPSPNLIAPDRATLAKLDYLALGDWHGQIRIDARSWYAGTPEPDDFPANEPGYALLVTLDGPGTPPIVEQVSTRHFLWQRLEVSNPTDAADIIAQVERAIDEAGRGDRLVLALRLHGQIDLAGRYQLMAKVNDWEARLAHLRIDDRLRDEPSEADITTLARGSGMVAATARRLVDYGNEAEARLALRHLYDLVMTVEG